MIAFGVVRRRTDISARRKPFPAQLFPCNFLDPFLLMISALLQALQLSSVRNSVPKWQVVISIDEETIIPL